MIFQYFKVYHVNSATTYRPQVFLNQSEAGLAKFENWDTQTPESIQLCLRPASTPPLQRCSKILHSVRASNLASLPPAIHSNCSERMWLHARTILVALENYSGWPGELS